VDFDLACVSCHRCGFGASQLFKRSLEEYVVPATSPNWYSNSRRILRNIRVTSGKLLVLYVSTVLQYRFFARVDFAPPNICSGDFGVTPKGVLFFNVGLDSTTRPNPSYLCRRLVGLWNTS